MSPILEVQSLVKQFTGLKAVSEYSVTLNAGSIQGLIGPNGAGKSTVFNLITGVLKTTAGKVVLNGRDITDMRPDRITKLGMARTFQNLRLFNNLTVMENVLVGAQLHKSYGLLSTITNLPSFVTGEQALRNQVMEILELLELSQHANQLAGNLPYGDQRRLEIARAMATKPKLLLLDEPAAGMNPQESHELINTIKNLRDTFNLTVLLIEHDMHVVMNLCEDIQVLSYGEIIAEGKPADIQSNPQVIEAYLGRAATVDRAN